MNPENEYYFKYIQKCEELEILYSEACEYKHKNEQLMEEITKLKSKNAELERYIYIQHEEWED